MAKQRSNIKKSDQNKPWNRRQSQSKVYAVESRMANTKRFIIYCEGQNTEPCYFKSFPVFTAEVITFGLGRSKISLVEHVIALTELETSDSEREIWIVFDMDFDLLKDRTSQRNDFNQAIYMAEQKGFRAAYSNDSFELWFVLHYQLLGSALTRAEYYQLISGHWQMSYERHGKGMQFCRSIYQRLHGSQENAIRNAERLHNQQQDNLPADQNPCTTVYQLVSELNKYLRK